MVANSSIGRRAIVRNRNRFALLLRGIIAVSSSKRVSSVVLGSPILWGIVVTVGFYGLIRFGVISDALLVRYFASHPMEYITTTLFFVGLTALVMMGLDVLRQQDELKKPLLELTPIGGEPAEQAEELLARLAALPRRRQGGWLVHRFREALEHVRRKGSADSLDEHLKYLADVESERAHGSFALVRVIIWAVPILGFLGTVIGITLAIANLSPEALEESLTEVTAGLGVAFDTTALALALSIVLMFSQFVVERMMNRLLLEVDERVTSDLAARFDIEGAGTDPHLAAIRRMADAVLNASERLVSQQADLWQQSLNVAQQRWQDLTANSGEQLETALSAAIERSMKQYAKQMQTVTESSEEKHREHWTALQAALTDTATAMRDQQSELTRQGEVLLRVVEATGQVTKLEDTLNQNLAALSGAANFEETLVSLAAAIQLLSARLGAAPQKGSQVHLPNRHAEGQAA